MLPPRIPISRIPGLNRSLRLPRCATRRPYTQTSRQLALAPPPSRPQLDFLSPTSTSLPQPPLSIHLRRHFARLFSTESRNYYRRKFSGSLKLGLSFTAILLLFQVVQVGVRQAEIEYQWPTPDEWSWKSRWCLRSAQAHQNPEKIGKLMTDWAMVTSFLRDLLHRLEDPELEGKGIVEQAEGGFLVDGVGKTGFDITAKSEPWRRGYWQALMGAAKAAESLEGWMTDRKERISAPAEYVVGPSNPRPKPMPTKQKKVLHEEDCEPASPPPQAFYVKILTTRGFTTGQKVEAALAYADWLAYKGLDSTADEVYQWAMDIAVSGATSSSSSSSPSSPPLNPSEIVDTKTGILRNDGQHFPSENILRVSTALAVHQARQGNLPTALAIFTSVLKARRSIPAGVGEPATAYTPTLPRSHDPFRSFFNKLQTTLAPAAYPPPPPTGDAPPARTPSAVCDEAALMTYIGEIIFASSSKETGLAWTRDAVDMAEATMLEMSAAGTGSGSTPDPVANTRCADCLRVGLANWKTMVKQLTAHAEQEEDEAIEQAAAAAHAKASSWLSWFGRGSKSNDSLVQQKILERKRWEAEGLILDERRARLDWLVEDYTPYEGIAPNASLFT
ncbi:uncharacterized protein BP01DRAFT_341708 [Aspergillus saccharolyticus JOP 1030-1]|uniref:MFS maltose permease n=1 Tax=Aspergillus saccharolyticus JOP 1030-1 TaxID=1450539 RepID=A0A318ZF53_9EURO|nr:hypothetical protein BP01DRAFT_341708 [Aspergillus saccharolyticus JOP 1030-1]PYH44934.1 hypothetical protein BP01DRAFT_341708 [Aspergillus saccharolyticus JOP 1030-1]